MAPCVLEVDAVQGVIRKDTLHGYLVTFHLTGLHLWGSNALFTLKMSQSAHIQMGQHAQMASL